MLVWKSVNQKVHLNMGWGQMYAWWIWHMLSIRIIKLWSQSCVIVSFHWKLQNKFNKYYFLWEIGYQIPYRSYFKIRAKKNNKKVGSACVPPFKSGAHHKTALPGAVGLWIQHSSDSRLNKRELQNITFNMSHTSISNSCEY